MAVVLLEREDQLTRLGEALAAAHRGEGRVVLVEGPAGMGKTALLLELKARAEAAGMRVLRARGAELEQEFGYGIVRQLLDPRRAGYPAIEGGSVRVGAGDQPVEAADPLGPVQRHQPVLDAEHRWRVDRLALEDAVDQLPAFRQAEDLGQRPRRGLAFEPLDCTGGQHEHAVRRLAP